MDAVQTYLQSVQEAVGRIAVENFVIPGFLDALPVRLYRPVGIDHAPAVLYFHGGGFVAGDLDDADIPASFLAEKAAAAVFSVAYSLAPARPFPAAPEDAYAAAQWLRKQGKRLGIDSSRLAVAGDDAGGNIAATLALILRDRNAPPLLAQVLIGPMLDPSMTRQGDAKKLRSDLQPETCSDCYAQYLPKTLQKLHPYASPLESTRLQGLPPALIATAECDVLHREAEQYASALITAGVPTQITRYAVKHAELNSHLPLLAEAAEFLQRRFAAGPETALEQ
ncbi:MAG TPA: alpha/beta hydrolase [Rhodocyclaceae bacterium]|jgi:acetyl esterase/lipase